MGNISNGEKLLDLVEMNKAKLNILSKMRELEVNGDADSKEYRDLIIVYEAAASIYKKKVIKLTDDEKNELNSTLYQLNENKIGDCDLEQLLNLDDKRLALWRTLLDLNCSLLCLYEKNENRTSNIKKSILTMLGYESAEEKTQINAQAINDFMVSDYINSLYNTIDREYQDTFSCIDKNLLLKWKYNLIYISDDIENRALMTRFSIPKYPRLVNELTIETAGISATDYLNEFDKIITEMLENVIVIMIKQIVKDEKHKADVFKIIMFYALIDLLCDKEVCESLIIQLDDMNITLSDKMRMNLDSINYYLQQAQSDKPDDYKRLRKNKTI